jgi:hypothetical protein
MANNLLDFRDFDRLWDNGTDGTKHSCPILLGWDRWDKTQPLIPLFPSIPLVPLIPVSCPILGRMEGGKTIWMWEKSET